MGFRIINRTKAVKIVDENDLRILELLQEDASLTFTEVGKRLKFNESTVRKRIKLLRDRGVIKNSRLS